VDRLIRNNNNNNNNNRTNDIEPEVKVHIGSQFKNITIRSSLKPLNPKTAHFRQKPRTKPHSRLRF